MPNTLIEDENGVLGAVPDMSQEQALSVCRRILSEYEAGTRPLTQEVTDAAVSTLRDKRLRLEAERAYFSSDHTIEIDACCMVVL